MSPLIYDDWGEGEEWFDFDSLLLDPADKVEESRFFLSLMEKEANWNRFRWLTTAFLGSAYSFFETAALRAHYCFSDPETGEAIPADDALERLSQYVSVFHEKKRQRVKTGAKHPLLRKLYEARRGAIHHFPLAIRSKETSDPEQFQFDERDKRDGTPVLPYCREVLALMEAAWADISQILV